MHSPYKVCSWTLLPIDLVGCPHKGHLVARLGCDFQSGYAIIVQHDDT